jgi:uncharacterized membrane protein
VAYRTKSFTVPNQVSTEGTGIADIHQDKLNQKHKNETKFQKEEITVRFFKGAPSKRIITIGTMRTTEYNERIVERDNATIARLLW